MNHKRFAGLTIATAAGLLLATAMLTTAVPANAAIYYPWCARYSGGDGSGGGDNCYFSTREQCMDTVRGIGGVCEPNGFYDAARADERAPIKATPKRRH
jgi:hypothetical protein